MKLISTILFFISITTNATNYYISNTGSDVAAGTSAGTAWQTIAKVNSSSFAVGDSILFKCGDVWNEKLIFPSSGSTGNPIIISSYGTGLKPEITGFVSLPMSNAGGNVWTGTASSSVINQNTVLVDNVIRGKARYPNSGYLVKTAFPSVYQLVVPHSTTSYTGYDIAIRSARWVIDVLKIAADNKGVTNDTFNLRTAAYASSLGGNYFLQNNAALLDSAYEYSYDSTSKLISVYATSSPTVKYSSIDTLVYLNGKSYLTINGLKFTGANITALQLVNGVNITLQNCTIASSYNGVLSYGTSNNITLSGDTIINILSKGAAIEWSTGTNINNNYIKNIGIIAGMGDNGSDGYAGIISRSYTSGISAPQITNNRVDSCGYNGIRFGGNNSLVSYNYVTNYSFVKDDGGGIYTWVDNLYPNSDTGSVIYKNIILNGLGAKTYYDETVTYAHGVYLDDNVKGVTVNGNLIYSYKISGIFFKWINTKLLNNAVIQTGTDASSNLYTDRDYSSFSLGWEIRNNITYRNEDYYSFGNIELKGSVDTTEDIDSNYHLNPASSAPFRYNNTPYSLADWRSTYHNDYNGSVSFPTSHTSTTPLVIYNPTMADSTVTLGGNYADVYNNIYFGDADLTAFEFKVLFPSNETPPPPPPTPYNIPKHFKFKKVKTL